MTATRRPNVNKALAHENKRLRNNLDLERASHGTDSAALADHKETIEQFEARLFACQKSRDEACDRATAASRHKDELLIDRDRLEAEIRTLKGNPLVRRKLPDSRRSLTIKLRINRGSNLCPDCCAPLPGSQVSLHLMLGFYDDGTLGELFVKLDRSRRGSAAATWADEWAKAVSHGLQYNLPIKWVIEKARHVRDESAGTPFVWDESLQTYRPHTALRQVGSAVDYIAVIILLTLNGLSPTNATAAELAALEKKLAEE